MSVTEISQILAEAEASEHYQIGGSSPIGRGAVFGFLIPRSEPF